MTTIKLTQSSGYDSYFPEKVEDIHGPQVAAHKSSIAKNT